MLLFVEECARSRLCGRARSTSDGCARKRTASAAGGLQCGGRWMLPDVRHGPQVPIRSHARIEQCDAVARQTLCNRVMRKNLQAP
jgi:hypothetical protein